MRLLHTSDWHLGHSLHGVGREPEHDAFLGWHLHTLAAREVDALLVCGDVFDTANPPAHAQASWYRFLARARRRLPGLDVVVVGGNHDSAARLDAPNPMLRELGIHVVGGLPRLPGGELDLDRLVLPLTGHDGRVEAWVGAVPFLRAGDLRAGEDGGEEDPLVGGVRRVYAEVAADARRRAGGRPVVLTGHCYASGTRLSALSERKVLGGNQHALPADLFPAEAAYVALGHLHLAQDVAGGGRVRYSGSPLPLALSESAYPHQVCLVEIDGAGPARVEAVRVPRAVEILHRPEAGAAPLDEVLALLADLPGAGGAGPRDSWPFLEVRVFLQGPVPALRRQVEQALEGRAVRLLRLGVEHGGHGRALGDLGARDLKDFSPEEVFVQRFRRDHDGEPPAPLLEAFHELVHQVCQGEGAP
ncbi:MAG: exonuclease SbcCD subunit D C-terminal domain-containing protein [Deferrisomatales bacterium]